MSSWRPGQLPLPPIPLFPTRFALGHFDDPRKPRNPYRRIPASVVGSPEHLALAREAAAKVGGHVQKL